MVNYNLSNGTCYFAQNSETKGEFIPCGNVASGGNWPCCKTGDACLGYQDANACYNNDSGNTYLAGCTDVSYGDRVCPHKGVFDDQEWVSINQCGIDDDGLTEWGGCKNSPANETALEKVPLASCSGYCASTLYLWVGGATISAFATVPSTAGGSVTWANDFNPLATATVAADTTTVATTPTSTTSTPTTTSTSTTSSALTTTSTSDSQDSGLDTGAKIGIGIGTVGAAALIITTILLALLVRRRKKKRQQAQAGLEHAGAPGTPYGPHWQSAETKPPQDMDLPPYQGFKHELPADQGQPMGNQHLSVGAVAVSPQLSTVGPDNMSVSNASTLMLGHGGSAGYVSPQSTGNGGYTGSYHGHRGSLSELQG